MSRKSTNESVSRLLQEYEINFESIFDRKDFREAFHDYLKSQVMAESFAFFVAVEQYQLLKASASRYQAANEILNNFLLSSSPHPVNVSGSDKSEVLNGFEQCSQENCSKTLFDKLQSTIFLELKCEKFPMFVKSSTLEHFLEQKGALAEEYLSQVGKKKRISAAAHINSSSNLLLPQQQGGNDAALPALDAASDILTTIPPTPTTPHFLERYNDADIEPATCLTKLVASSFSAEDFKTAKKLIKSTTIWNSSPSTNKNGYSLQISTDAYAVAKRNVKLYKESAVLPYTADELLWALTDVSVAAQLEPNVTTTHLHYVPRTGADDFAHSINELIFRFPFPFSKRQFIISTSAYKTTSGNYLLVKKSVDYPNVKATGVRGSYFGGILLEKLSDITCRYTIVARMDMKGNFSEAQMNSMLSRRNEASITQLTRALLFRRNLKMKKPKESNKVLDTVEANAQTVDNSLISV